MEKYEKGVVISDNFKQLRATSFSPVLCCEKKIRKIEKMKTEIIDTILFNGNYELVLILAGEGDPIYQYVYREAAGVYWDNNLKAFQSTLLREWTISDWFFHIKDIVKTSLNVELKLSDSLNWKNVSEIEQEKIRRAL